MITLEAYIGVWVLFVTLATLSLGARLWVRLRLLRRSLDWDDWIIIAAYITVLASESCVMVLSKLSVTIAEGNGTLDTLSHLRKILWFLFWPFTLSCWLIKFSLLAFYSRLFYFSLRKAIWLTGGFLFLSLMVVIVLAAVLCLPPERFWTATIENVNGQLVPHVSCPSVDAARLTNTVQVALSLSSDVVILVLPIMKIWKLKISTRQKLALVGLFTIGTIIAVIEVIRGVIALNISALSIELLQVYLILFTLQSTVGIVVTNLPILRPLFFARSFGSSSGGSASNAHASHRTSRLSWTNRQRDRGIPLHDMPEYGSHAAISSGDAPHGHSPESAESGAVLKSVEVRIYSESVPSSIHSDARNDQSKFSN